MKNPNKIANQLVRIISQGIKLTTTRSGKVEKVIHASSLYDFCFRKYVLAYKNNIVVNTNDKLPLRLKVTFKLGLSIEAMIIEALTNHLVGTLKRCNQCETYKYTPDLFTKTVGEYKITGHPDAIVELDNKVYILELKSMDKDIFRGLTEPILQHTWQLMTYLYLGKDKRIADTGFIIYVSKGQNNSPIKIYPVTTTPEFTKYIADIIKEMKTFSKTNRLPKRVCNNKMFPLARKCPVVDLCFRRWII